MSEENVGYCMEPSKDFFKVEAGRVFVSPEQSDPAHHPRRQ
jgi:hypothetical protein